LNGYVPRPAWADEKYDKAQVNTSMLGATSIGWYSCSSSQQSIVNNAIANAKTEINNCRTYMGKWCDNAYVTIFGSYIGSSPSRWTRVKNTYNYMNDRINSNFQIHCAPSGCGDPPCYAYVYPSDSGFRIHLCGKFWAAPATSGYDTQFGVMIHEFSHFSSVGATDDHQYGRTSCVNMATHSPSLAVDNADSYEYFAEDRPRCG